ncbi:AGAP005114-PA, partial [Anopheles gambiae str. PEST]|uniref:Uncharacterized protein n=2 Tax=gambiae species complex TaxID=44542 RepID=A0A6E8VLY0_ANOCL
TRRAIYSEAHGVDCFWYRRRRRVLLPLLLLLWFVVCFVAIATNQTVTSSNPTPSEVCECEQKRVQRWRSLERRV